MTARALLRLHKPTANAAPLADEPPLSTGAPPGVWHDPWGPEGVVVLRAFDAHGKFAGCFYCPADAYDPRLEESLREWLANLNAKRAAVPKLG
jgi:hypothetical protein